MTKEEFINKYTNDVFDKNTLLNVYSLGDLNNEDNMKDFMFLYPVLKELCYYKNNLKNIISKNYEDKETLKLLTNSDDYFIYSLLDKGIKLDDIIAYQMKSFKRVISKLLSEIIVSSVPFSKIESDFKNKIVSMLEKDLSIDEIECKVYKPSYQVSLKFDSFCKMLNL